MLTPSDILLLSRIPRVGPRRLKSLVEQYGDLAGIVAAPVRNLARVRGISPRLAQSIVDFFRGPAYRDARRMAEEQVLILGETGGGMLCLWDDPYPGLLSRIYDPPPVLFYRGTPPGRDLPCMAIVGTRRPTQYGKGIAEYFGRELAGKGFAVVSGMARGIDTVVHETVLKAGGTTLAVVGTGLDVTYPPENHRLAGEIERSGSLLSEYFFGTGPEPGNFPRRNRIISGLCHGTIVVESDVNGGAMITARLALDQNREVFAVPGPARSAKSRGCHRLIGEGRARICVSIDDVIAEVTCFAGRAPVTPAAGDAPDAPVVPGEDGRLLAFMEGGPVHIDTLAEASGLEMPDLHVRLLMLEMNNLVRQLPGKYFMKET